jgi:hypothetical protein
LNDIELKKDNDTQALDGEEKKLNRTPSRMKSYKSNSSKLSMSMKSPKEEKQTYENLSLQVGRMF